MVLSGVFVGQTVSAIYYSNASKVPAWEAAIKSISLVGLTIQHSGSGPAIDAGPGHAITVLDTTIACGTPGLLTGSDSGDRNSTAIRAQGNAYLNHVFFAAGCHTLLAQPGSRHSDVIAAQVPGASPAVGTVEAVEVARGTNTFSRGAMTISDLMFVDGVRHPNRTISTTRPVGEIPAGLTTSRIPWDSARFPSVETATDATAVCGALGDGVTDDFAALQGCLNDHDAVLLPAGLYRVSGTLVMRPNTALIGVSQTHSVVAPMSRGFNGSDADTTEGDIPVALLRTSREGNATIAFVGLTTWWHLPNVFTLDWRARGGLWRSNYETRVGECLWLDNYANRSRSVPCKPPAALTTPKTQVRGGGVFVNYVSDEVCRRRPTRTRARARSHPQPFPVRARSPAPAVLPGGADHHDDVRG